MTTAKKDILSDIPGIVKDQFNFYVGLIDKEIDENYIGKRLEIYLDSLDTRSKILSAIIQLELKKHYSNLGWRITVYNPNSVLSSRRKISIE
jgi:hypothetical protein